MAATVCAILSATVGTPRTRTPPPDLGDFHGSHRRREVASRRHPIPDPIQVLLAILFEILDRLAVHPGRTLEAYSGEEFLSGHRRVEMKDGPFTSRIGLPHSNLKETDRRRVSYHWLLPGSDN